LAALLCAVLWASYASAVVALFAGVFLAFLFFFITKIVPRRYSVVFILVIVVSISFFVLVLPQGQQTFDRVIKPSEDLSGAARVLEINSGIQAFGANVWIGYGAYSDVTYTPSGIEMSSHSTFLPMAYQFGLLFLIPFLWLLFTIAQGYYRLVRRASRTIDKALAIGMAASFGAALITAWATPVFMEPGQDAIIWFFIGLMAVWNHWLNTNPDSVLVE
jgi:cell division protein FtsW (lipid II flippase)